MTSPPGHQELREELFSALQRRVIGPRDGPDETLRGLLPTQEYITGVLAPRDRPADPEENDSLHSNPGDEDESPESGASEALSNAFKPSAMGLTCIVDKGVKAVEGAVFAARYVLQGTPPSLGSQNTHGLATSASTGAGDEEMPASSNETPSPEGEKMKGRKRKEASYKRVAVNSEAFVIPLGTPAGKKEFHGGRYSVEWRTRPAGGKAGACVLTVTIVNMDEATDPADARDVERHLFQVCLRLSGLGDNRAVFLPRKLATKHSPSEEGTSMDLLYRDRLAFATGHGCATSWDATQGDRTSWVQTECLPTYELPLVESPEMVGEFLDLEWLTSADRKSVMNSFSTFATEYEGWIGEQVKHIPAEKEFSKASSTNLAACRLSLKNIREGISRLESDDTAWEAFRLMNQAMALQFRWTHPSSPKKPRWRTFQLGFILHSLVDASEGCLPQTPVPLLWFPTGGGKTEAYLGLSAYVISLRRLRGPRPIGAGGVTVLMRYTLRLLTTQQFQRAASLICALEKLRRGRKGELGEEEISLGLWVGQSSTPNRLSEAFDQLRRPSDSPASPVQLSRCPACQTPLPPAISFQPSADRKSLVIHCPNGKCDFNDKLPIYTVDEEIYRRCPTMLVGTVDKFARLPWEAQTRAFFGKVKGWCPEHGYTLESYCSAGGSRCQVATLRGIDPPSLIIQDELHLISGPLGTMVGVYEALIDFLSQKDGKSPLIVGSSATVRRADKQVHNLYGRKVTIFPPRALSAEDTFFSRTIPLSEKRGRLYVGILPAGFTVKSTLVRVYASLLVDRRGFHDYPGPGDSYGRGLWDPYWTQIGYFNSLRELGGAVRLVEDDVPAQAKVYAQDRSLDLHVDKEELTSRRKGAEIPSILGRIEQSLPDALDMLLATNMISVGVDVKRLSVMTVTGQPKATAEYIQATSRVGREFPGLVITVYNWARPRDRSHMEDFVDYHAALYRHVEANSVTPYTEPALRRGLHALIVASIRVLEPGMAENDSAAGFRKELPTVQRLRSFVLGRLADPGGDGSHTPTVERLFDSAVDRWQEMIRLSKGRLSYVGGKIPLLREFELSSGDPTIEGGFPTLNSLRSVEPSAGLKYEAT